MMPHDPSKSGFPKLPMPYSNGHGQVPATALTGATHIEADPGPAAAAPEVSEVSVFRALRRCWLPALFLGLLGAAAAAAGTWYAWPARYSAVALVQVVPRPGTYGEDLQLYVRTQSALLKSRKIIESALRQENVLGLSVLRDEADPVAIVEKSLVVDTNLGPEILRATLSGEQPEELAVLLNAIVAAFVKEASQSEQAAFQAKSEQLQAKKREYETLLREKRNTLQGLEERYGPEALQSTAQRREVVLQQLVALEKDLLQTQVDLKVAVKELAALTGLDQAETVAAISDAAVEDYLRQDPRSQQLQTEVLKVDQDAARVREIATEQTLAAELERLASRRTNLQKALDDRRRDVRPLVEKLTRAKRLDGARDNRTKLEARKVGLEERERQLETQIQRLKTAAREPGRRIPEVDALRDAVASLESGLKKVTEQLDSLKIDAPTTTRVSALDPAVSPRSKTTDRAVKIAAAAGLAGFGLLFAGIVWREVRTRRVYGATDVVGRLGTGLLGTLPVLPARARRAAPDAAGREGYWQQLLGESVDAIRTQLLRAAQTEGLKIVMVTSAVGGEGKTSLASHLAVSLARAWRKTLLLDGDLRKPAVHRQFDQPLEPGFCDVLRAELDFSDVVRPTPVSRLWVAAAGQWNAHALQALAQDSVTELFAALKEQYDFVVIDASPVLPVADTLSLGQHADGVIFTVLRDVSRLPAVQAAHQRLATLDIRVLGTVVIGANDDLATLGYSSTARPRVSTQVV